MRDFKKSQGIIPAFYACYDAEGGINTDAVRKLTRWFIEKGVQGVYVGGSSGSASTSPWPSVSWSWRTSWPRARAS